MSDQPNILLVVTDQQRLSTIGAYGPTPCRTPNLDRLAAEGLRFENTYTTCPICSPARASLITGQYPSRHGVTDNVTSLGCAISNIPDYPGLLPRRLGELGYQCGYTGKWHLCPEANYPGHYNQPSAHTLPSDVGFVGQDFKGHGDGGFVYQEYRDYLSRLGTAFSLRPESINSEENGWPRYGIQEGAKEVSVDHFLTNHTIDLIDRFQGDSQPFFIWHNYWGPHEPYYPVEEFFAPYRDMEIPPWETFEGGRDKLLPHLRLALHPRSEEFSWEVWERAIRHYYAFATQIDYEIGRLYEHLETQGLLENTIIIFTSDHGESIGDFGGMTNKGNSSFDFTQRVGLIVRYPERYRPADSPAGSVKRDLASLADIHSTCIDMAGGDPNAADTDGVSLHSASGAQDRDAIFVECFGILTPTTMITCRSGAWKYAWNPGRGDELYNLEEDPHETCNRIADPDCAEIRHQMIERLATHLPPGTNVLPKQWAAPLYNPASCKS